MGPLNYSVALRIETTAAILLKKGLKISNIEIRARNYIQKWVWGVSRLNGFINILGG